jgi:hypothetical protein
MVLQKGIIVLDLKPLISQCSRLEAPDETTNWL